MCNEQVLCSMHDKSTLLDIVANPKEGKISDSTLCYGLYVFLEQLQTHKISHKKYNTVRNYNLSSKLVSCLNNADLLPMYG